MARLVAVAAGALLVLAGCGNAPSAPDGAAPSTPPGPAVVHAPFRCPGPHGGGTSDHGSDSLPTGATAALICMNDGGTSWSRPTDVLTRGVGPLIDLINGQQIDHATEDPCLGPAGLGYVIVLRYADGTRSVSGGSDPGCSRLLVGSSERVGTRLVLFAYLRALVDQRLGTKVPAAPTEPPLSCDQPFTVGELIAVPQRTTTAIVCQGSDAHRRLVSRLDDRQTALLRDDLATSSARRTTWRGFEDKGVVSPHTGVVVARDAWGDVFRVDVSNGDYRMLPTTHETYRYVRMLPATADMLDRILA